MQSALIRLDSLFSAISLFCVAELSSHNPFFSNMPEAARQRLLKAELMRTYKLHVAVSNPHSYFRSLSTALLSQILRSSDFRSEAVRTLTREVMTTFVFMPVIKFIDPYWLVRKQYTSWAGEEVQKASRARLTHLLSYALALLR